MSYTVEKYRPTRFWAVVAPGGELVAVVVYKRGAAEVARLLNTAAGRLPASSLED
jgi:hypothetical protein